jgi:hypothetical protein
MSPGRRGGSSCVVPAAWKTTLTAALRPALRRQCSLRSSRSRSSRGCGSSSISGGSGSGSSGSGSSSSYNRMGRAKEETNGPLSSINHLERCVRPTTADPRPTRPRRSHTASKGEATSEGGPVARKLQSGRGSGDTAGCCCTLPDGVREDALGPSPTASHFHSTMRLQNMPAECASSSSSSMSSFFSATRSRPQLRACTLQEAEAAAFVRPHNKTEPIRSDLIRMRSLSLSKMLEFQCSMRSSS